MSVANPRPMSAIRIPITQHRSARAQTGFTLIEMIAAIALMSLTMLAIAGGVGAAMKSLLPAAHAIEASELAHAQLDALCVDGELGAGTRTGTSNGHHWMLTLSPGPSSGAVRLIAAHLRVDIGIRHYGFDTACAVSNATLDRNRNGEY